MKHVKKIVFSITAMSLLALFLLSLATVPTDAAAVLDSPQVTTANIGNSFSIDAMGEAFSYSPSPPVRVLARMHIEFTIIRNATRGVVFNVTSGLLIMNSTDYVATGGLGLAGRLEQGHLNQTLVFGFRINMTEAGGAHIQLAFRGYVDRSVAGTPILYMRGRITLESSLYNLVQRGRIHKLET
jgi:hypothetical protein